MDSPHKWSVIPCHDVTMFQAVSKAIPPDSRCSMYDVSWVDTGTNCSYMEVNQNVTHSCTYGYDFEQGEFEFTATSYVSKTLCVIAVTINLGMPNSQDITVVLNNLPYLEHVKIGSVLQTAPLTVTARPVKFTRYCLTQWISKLSGSFEIHGARQYLINVVLFGIRDL